MKGTAWLRMMAPVAALLTCLVLDACGDPVATLPRPGQPILTFNASMAGMGPAPGSIVGLVWHTPLDMFPGNENNQWIVGVTKKLVTINTEFSIEVFGPPPEGVYPYVVDTSNGGWKAHYVFAATATILVVADRNQDDRFDLDENGLIQKPDVLVGVANDLEIVFVDDITQIQEWLQKQPVPITNPQALRNNYNLVRTIGQSAEVVPLDTVITIGPPPSP